MVQLSWQDEESHMSVAGSSAAVVIRTVTFSSRELMVLTGIGSLLCLAIPRTAHFISAIYRLLLGTLYPAYASYKAVRTKDVKEYVS